MDNTKNSAQKLSIFTESAQKPVGLKAIIKNFSKKQMLFSITSAFIFPNIL